MTRVAAADTNSSIEEVTVTARRIAEDPQNVPVAVTVLSSAKLDVLAINTPLDLNKIPGLTGSPTGSLNNVNFAIRGQGTAYGGQPGVIQYFAEVPNFPLSYFDLQDVQVIKGPQGTLFGQTSTGGVVLFEPKRPSDQLTGYVDLQAGNHGYTQLEGALNLPMVADTLFVRLAAQLRNRNGWATGIHTNGDQSVADLNNVDNALFRLSVTWKPAQDLELYTVYEQDEIRSHGTSSVLYYIDPRLMSPAIRNVAPASVPSLAAAWKFWTGYAPPPGQTFSQLLVNALDQQLTTGALTTHTDFNQRSTTVNRGVIDQLTWNVAEGVRIKNIFGLRWQTLQGGNYDLDGSNLPLDGYECRHAPGTTSTSGSCAKTGGWPNRTLTDEIQIQGLSFGRKLQWQAGAFYLQGGVRQFAENTLPVVAFGRLTADPASTSFCSSVNVPWPCASLARTDTHSKALFGQATYEVVERVHLTAGYRETWDYTKTETTAKPSYQVPIDGQLVTVPVYGGAPPPGATTVNTVVDLPANSSYNVTGDWRPNDTVMVYVAHRSGYKSGGINSVADPGSPQRTYGPERAKDLELGTKTNWTLGGVRGQVDADVYHTWYSNIQEGEIIPGTSQTVTTNLANAKINGFELEGTLLPAAWARVTTGIAFTDAKFSKWTENSTCGVQYWRPQCVGLTPATPIVIDHAGGDLSVAGSSTSFTPDRFSNTSRWQWSVQPALILKPWIGADITLSANFYHRGPFVDSTAATNNSVIAGLTPIVRKTVFGYSTGNPFDAPGYTLADLRLDWRHLGGSQLSVAAAVTNVADRIYRASSSSAFQIIGDVYTVIGEPRMWFAQAIYEF